MKYCPACGKEGLQYPGNRYWNCNSCGFTLYNNVAAATGVIFFCLNDDKSRTILVEERAMDPGKGKLGLPGGFVDPDERAEDCAVRECQEEIGITVSEDKLQYLTSMANTYEYKSITYKTCDVYFLCEVTAFEMFRIKKAAVMQQSEVRRITTIDIRKDTDVKQLPFAFVSANNALKQWQTTF